MRVSWFRFGGGSVTSDDLDMPIPSITTSDESTRARGMGVSLGNYTIISSHSYTVYPERLYLLGPAGAPPLRLLSRMDGHGVVEQHARLGGTTTAGSVDRSPRINTGASGTYR